MLRAPLHIKAPLLYSYPLSKISGSNVYLKLDAIQPSGSFKIRGIGRTVQEAAAKGCKHIFSSSGGNAGLAAAYAGKQLDIPVTVILPHSSPDFVVDKLDLFGAKAIFHGSQWSEAHAHAQTICAEYNGHLVHPFAEETTWLGHSTIVDELVDELQGPPDAIVTVCGGGGLLMGLLKGIERHADAGWGNVPIVVVETDGADSLAQSLDSGRLETLPEIKSYAKTLGAATVDKDVFEASLKAGSNLVRSLVVDDKEAIEACARFLDDHRLLVEPSCGAGLAAVYNNHTCLQGCDTVVIEVCGGALMTFDALAAYKRQFNIS